MPSFLSSLLPFDFALALTLALIFASIAAIRLALFGAGWRRRRPHQWKIKYSKCTRVKRLNGARSHVCRAKMPSICGMWERAGARADEEEAKCLPVWISLLVNAMIS